MQTRYFGQAPRHPRRFAPVPGVCLSALAGGMLLIGGCTRQPPPSAEPRVLRLGAQDTAETANVLVEMLSTEPLLVLDWHGRAVPRLASEWEWLDHGRALSVRLRSGVRFQNGTPLTAAA